MYSENLMPKREVFYNGNRGSQLLFRARINSSEINDRTDRFSAIGNRACQMCSMMEANEMLDHFKSEFPSYKQCRDWAI